MCNQILPKLWLEAIQTIWDKKVPTDYPRTKTEFSLTFDSKETKDKVKEMEENLKTENTILSFGPPPKGIIVSTYFGTYNVKGTPGELTLLSPQRVDDRFIDVIAMHLNEESGEWERIEDAKIVDEFAYGTVESFSQIALFGVKRDTFLTDSCPIYDGSVFVCNGVPVFISKNEDGEIVAVDGNNKETILPKNCHIVGGTIDGSDIKSTSISIEGIETEGNVVGGSFNEDGSVYVDNISITAKNSSIRLITGSFYNNRAENVTINLENVIISSGCGIGQSYWAKAKKDSNKADSKGFGSNAYVKNGVINIKDCKIPTLFVGGNSGYLYVDKSEAVIDGGDYTYIIVSGSNGNSCNIKAKIENVNAKKVALSNRGSIETSDATIKNSTIEELFVGGELSDSATAVAGKLRIDICIGTKATLVVGNDNKEKLTAVTAEKLVESLKISRSTDITISDEDKLILGDIIKIK